MNEQSTENALVDETASNFTETETLTKEDEHSSSEAFTQERQNADSLNPQTKTASEETAAEADKLVRTVPDAASYKLPDGIPVTVAEFAHKNDMTQDQLDTTLTEFSGYLSQMESSQKAHIKTEGESMVKNWGDSKEANISTIDRALDHIDPKGSLKDLLQSSGYNYHPVVLDHLLSVGNLLSEGGFMKGSDNVPKGPATAAQVLFPTHTSVQQ